MGMIHVMEPGLFFQECFPAETLIVTTVHPRWVMLRVHFKVFTHKY